MQVRVLLGLLLLSTAIPGAKAVQAAGSDIKAEIVRTRDLVENRKNPVVIDLQRANGAPVTLDDLAVVHTEPVHLLIIDPTLTDYHHEHPTPMSMPGNYVFTMTPKTACGYRVWADLQPKKGAQQFATADIPGTENCRNKEIDRTLNMEVESGNYRFKLSFDTPGLEVGRNTIAKLTVRADGGRYIDELQPIMGTYGHMVGFYDDYQTIAHVHPMGEEPTSYSDRGGPTLEFHINPVRSGFMKLFTQFRINNQVVFADFGVHVDEAMEWERQEWDEWEKDDVISETEEIDPVDTSVSTSDRAEIERILAEENRRLEEEHAQEQSLEDLFVDREAEGEVEIYEDLEKKILGNETPVSAEPAPPASEEETGRLQPVSPF